MDTEPLYNLIVQHGFDHYQPGLQSRFKAYGFNYSYKYCQHLDNPVLFIDFVTVDYLGRMIAWTRGTCHLEVLDCATREIIFEQHYDLPTEHDFHKKLAEIALFIEEKIKTKKY